MPPGEALPDAKYFAGLPKQMGFDGFDYKIAAEIYDEHCRLNKGYQH